MDITEVRRLMREHWHTVEVGRSIFTCLNTHHRWTFFRTGETLDGNSLVLWRRRCEVCGKAQVHVPDDITWVKVEEGAS